MVTCQLESCLDICRIKEERSAVSNHLDDRVLHLEHGTSKGALASIIETIWIRTVVDQHLDEVGMAVVGG